MGGVERFQPGRTVVQINCKYKCFCLQGNVRVPEKLSTVYTLKIDLRQPTQNRWNPQKMLKIHSFQNRLILNKYRMDFIFKTIVVKIAQWKDCEEGPSSQVIQTRTKCTKIGETVTLVLPRLSTWPPESRETKKMRERGAQSCCPT